VTPRLKKDGMDTEDVKKLPPNF